MKFGTLLKQPDLIILANLAIAILPVVAMATHFRYENSVFLVAYSKNSIDVTDLGQYPSERAQNSESGHMHSYFLCFIDFEILDHE